MRFFILLPIFCWAVSAQTANPNAIIGGVGNSLPTLPVAPGQLVTFFVPNSGVALTVPYKAQQATLPLSQAGFSAIFQQGTTDTPMPILMVQPVSTCTAPVVVPPGGGLVTLKSCGGTIAVTVQIPFGIDTSCPLCTSLVPYAAKVAIAIDGAPGPFIDVTPVSDQVHFLTSCDLIGKAPVGYLPTGLSCPPLVEHADGTVVSARSPAKSGEQLAAYLIGVGQTNPPMTTGRPATGPAAAAVKVDVNYRPNALATKPSPSGEAPPALTILYIGATPGLAGLYQMNFIVPPPPPGLAPCVDTTMSPPGINVVQTNLTVSVGLAYSFNGAGICVQPN